MSVGSFHFLIFLAGLAVTFQICRGKTSRQAVLAAANVAFLFPFVSNLQSWIVLVAFVAVSFAMVRIAQRRIHGLLLALFIALLVAVFLYVKSYAFLAILLPEQLLNHPLVLIGVSYMLFKLIHTLVDGWQGELVQVNPLTYANYQLGFFTLVAGPIQRYNDFAQFWDNMDSPQPDKREVMLAWSRILSGMVKMALIGGLTLSIYERAETTALHTEDPVRVAIAFIALFYTYPAFVYFNFSGYTDIVVGAGRLFGLNLPENFNRPYLARNMVDFWNRWHITLSNWIRDYVFMASYKWAAAKWTKRARNLAYPLAFLSLFIAGMWHGATWNFVMFGLVHGVGVAGTQMYGRSLRSVIGPSGVSRYMQNRWITGFAILVTFHYVCFGL